MFLQNILCGKLESLVLLMIKITLYASSLNNRVQELFWYNKTWYSYIENSSSEQSTKAIQQVNRNKQFPRYFFGQKTNFFRKISQALMELDDEAE